MAYDTLIAALEDASNKDDAMVKGTAHRPVASWFGTSDGVDTFGGILHLCQWKEHQTSLSERPKRLSILVEVSETIRRSGRTCVLEKSTVRVTYYRLSANHTRFVLGMHFDYTPGQTMHPVFHMQTTNEQPVLNEDTVRDLGFTSPISDSQAVSLRDVRIPTCDMTLPSVLLCLAANHLSPASFTEFLGKVRAHLRILPRPELGRLMESILADSTHLCSSHWFAHMA